MGNTPISPEGPKKMQGFGNSPVRSPQVPRYPSNGPPKMQGFGNTPRRDPGLTEHLANGTNVCFMIHSISLANDAISNFITTASTNFVREIGLGQEQQQTDVYHPGNYVAPTIDGIFEEDFRN